MKLKVAAKLVIAHPAKMTENGRLQIAFWLRRQALAFEKHGKNYSSKFTARFLYRP